MAEAPHTDRLKFVRNDDPEIGHTLVIEGPNHTRLQELQAEGETIGRALSDALGKPSEALVQKLGDFKKAIESLPDKELAQQAAMQTFMGKPQTVTLSPESQAAIGDLKKILDEHFPTELKAVADFAERNAAEIADRSKAELALIEQAQRNPLMVEGYERSVRKPIRALLDSKAADLADTVRISDLLAAKPAAAAPAETPAAKAAPAEGTTTATTPPEGSTPPPPPEAPKAEINIGELVVESGKAEFKNASHPAAREAHAKIRVKSEALIKNLAKKEFMQEKTALQNEFGTYRNGKTVDRSGDVRNAINDVMQGDFQALNGNLPAGAKEKIEALLEKHAKTQYAALKTEVTAQAPVLRQAERELLEAQIKHLGTAAKDMPEMESALGNLKNELQTKLDALGKSPIVPPPASKDVVKEKEAAAAETKEEGFWARQINKAKENLGVKAWEESKVKTGFRYFGLGVGLGMIGDAALRSKTKDENGNEVDRSGMGRVTEAVLGGVVGTGSAVLGGRGK